jgi:hypothetical protein
MRTEVDEIIRWLTGHSEGQLEAVLADGTDFRNFIEQAPAMNPARSLIIGTICADRVQDIEEPPKRDIRNLDKLIDELVGRISGLGKPSP